MDKEKSHAKEHMILRDRLATERTILANERTFLAYIRTALTAIAVGATVIHFSTTTDTRILGIIVMVLGFGVLTVGILRYFFMREEIRQKENGNY